MMHSIAAEVLQVLQGRKARLVLAESCTGGLVAATLTEISGASASLCGSFVTYTNEAKREWIGVPESMIEIHTEVSPEVAVAMVHGALDRTPSASVAASITGHLGPGAPPALDGRGYIATCVDGELRVENFHLAAKNREARQREAADSVLRRISGHLAASNER